MVWVVDENIKFNFRKFMGFRIVFSNVNGSLLGP
jgi:hypothetical protein